MFKTYYKQAAVMIVSLLTTVTAVAVPALRQWITRSLTDGTSVRVMAVGDEYGHWFVDEEGKTLTTNPDGTLYYMTDAEYVTCKAQRQQRSSVINAMRMRQAESLRGKGRQAASERDVAMPAMDAISGSVRGLVILVDFPDRSFSTPNPRDLFDERFNTPGYKKGKMIGSVHDYFHDQSYGKFDISFDVVGPIRLKHNMSYYGGNTSKGNDSHPAEIITEAVEQLRGQVDFSRYNWNPDADNYVDQVFVIYAGTGEHRTSIEDEIWAHESKLSNWGIACPKVNGVFVNTYAMSCELAQEGVIDGIGTACHEFAHCLGFPDFYDTDYSGGNGMGMWDLMHAGNYNGPDAYGDVPAPFTSYERWYAGWLTPIELTSPQVVKDMPPLTEEPVAYIVYNDAKRSEYFMFENHQPTGWDSYTTCYGNGTGHGMLILHVDYDKTAWESNTVNDLPKRQRMTYMSASGNYELHYPKLPGHLFPGTSSNTSFTDDSSPAARIYNTNSSGSNYLHKPITHITETNGKISFCFMTQPEAPEAVEPTHIGSSSFTASWLPAVGAKSYTLQVYPSAKAPDVSALLLSEDFSKLPASGSKEITNSLDDYTATKGWKGVKVYTDNGDLRLSNSSSYGYLVTPPVKPASGSLTLVFDARKYDKDASQFLAYLSAPSSENKLTKEDGTMYVHDVTLTTDWQQFIMHFDIPQSCSIYFEPGKRAYLDNLYVFDGYLSDEAVNAFINGAKGTGKSVNISNQQDGTIIITGITGTEYIVGGLTDTSYNYRVKAILDGDETQWSNVINVNLTPTAITEAVAPVSDAIYSLNGQYLGTDESRLPAGLYLRNGMKFIKN